MTEPKSGWFQRLTDGLSRSSKQMSEQVAQVFVAKEPLDQAKLDELEEMLIEADLGPQSAARIAERFSAEKFGKDVDEDEIKEALAEAVGDELAAAPGRLRPAVGAQALRRAVHRRERLGQDHDAGQDRRRPDRPRRQGADRRRRHLPRRRRRAAEGLGRPRRRRLHVAGRSTPTPPAWPSTPSSGPRPRTTTWC